MLICLALTPFVVKETETLERNARNSQNTKVHLSRQTQDEVRAEVQCDGITYMVGVKRNDDGDKLHVECCNFVIENMRPCFHVVAALLKAATISLFDQRLYGEVWYTSTWVAQLQSPVPNFNIDLSQLESDESFRPWQFPPIVGRPPEPKRRNVKPNSKTCFGCDKEGHNIRSCTEVDLDLIWAKLIGGGDPPYEPSEGDEEDESSSAIVAGGTGTDHSTGSGMVDDEDDADHYDEISSGEIEALLNERTPRKSRGRMFTEVTLGLQLGKRRK
jgi:hypothetical protein